MEIKEPIEFGKYYHIYNRGNNSADVFFETENYLHFLKSYAKYIEPVAETFAWCLLKNHFHILVRIKDFSEIKIEEMTYSTKEKPKVIDASRQFSHLFNSYTQSINKRYHRTGSLFEKPFERKLVTNEKYLKNLIYYIHNNPVHHGFVKSLDLYKWSSFSTILSNKLTKLKRNDVIEFYGGLDNFILYHHQDNNFNEILDLLIE